MVAGVRSSKAEDHVWRAHTNTGMLSVGCTSCGGRQAIGREETWVACGVYACAQGKPKATVVITQSQKASVLLVATVSTTSFSAFAIELCGVEGRDAALSPSGPREGS